METWRWSWRRGGGQEPPPPEGNTPPLSGEVPWAEEEVPRVVVHKVVAEVVAEVEAKVAEMVAQAVLEVVPGDVPERLGEGKEESCGGAPPPQPREPRGAKKGGGT